jgi:DNA-binding transcriptional MerR regulator
MSSQPSLKESPAGGFWSEKKVAAFFDVSERTVRRWAETGVIAAPVKIGGARRYVADKIQRVAGQ